MGAIRKFVGAGLLTIAYMCLGLGLFGRVVEFRYDLELKDEWFKGMASADTFGMAIKLLDGKPVNVIPHTVRALLGRTARLGAPSLMQVDGQAATPQSSSSVLAQKVHSRAKERVRGYRTALAAPTELENHGRGNMMQVRTQEEYHRGMIPWLITEAQQGRCGYFAPGTLIFFGLVLPSVKLALVAIWASRAMVMGDLAGSSLLQLAARLSRWTAVDVVAEALVVAMLLKSGMTAGHLPGYVAFIAYVVLSSLALAMLDDSFGTKPWLLQVPLPTLPTSVLICSLALYLVPLVVGATMLPLARLYVTEEAVEGAARLPAMQEQFKMLAMIGRGTKDELIGDFAKGVPKPMATASMVEAAVQLLTSQHLCTIVGSCVVFVLVLVFPATEACLAFAIAHGQVPASQKSLRYVLDLVADLALLDVFVVGVFAGTLVTGSISALEAHTLGGFYVLLCAAIVGVFHQVICGMAATAGLGGQWPPPKGGKEKGRPPIAADEVSW